jgi:hypothetical protein
MDKANMAMAMAMAMAMKMVIVRAWQPTVWWMEFESLMLLIRWGL